MKAAYRNMVPVVLSSMLILGCSGGGDPAAGKPRQQPQTAAAPVVAAGSDHAAGAQLYEKNCRVCHGNQGNGWGSRKGPSLQRSEYTYGRNREAVMESIVKGRPKGMPAYGSFFSQEQLHALTTYVLSLR